MAEADKRLSGMSLTRLEKGFWCMLPLLGFLWVAFTWHKYTTPYVMQWEWFPAIALNFSIRIDGLSLLMLMLIFGIGSAVFIYAAGYLRHHPQLRRLYVLLTAFALAMAGCVLADDLLLLFVFWELTSVLSFLLVGFNGFESSARNSARQAMLVTGMGGLCLLAGAIAIGQMAGTTRISELTQQLPELRNHAAFLPWLMVLLIGPLTKSAQFPFQFWLPNAMSAPTPVSAYLHSATMVKLGVYLLARLDAGLDDWVFWQTFLQIVGSITAGWGMLLALKERDLKRILAWSTVATLGTLVVMIGLPGENAALGLVTLLLAHALYKAPLFFVAGNIDHCTGTRIIDRLGRLRIKMPWTALAALLAGLSMAGMPLSFGYVAKETLAAAKVADETLVLSVGANMVFSIIAVAVAGVAAIRVFWRHPGENVTPTEIHRAGASMFLPPLCVAAIGLVLGFYPMLAEQLLDAAAKTIVPSISVEFVQHFDLNLWRDALQTVGPTIVLGVVVFIFWDVLHGAFDKFLQLLPRWGGADVYYRLIKYLPKWSALSTRYLQPGALSVYALWLVCFSTIAIGAALLIAMNKASLKLPVWQQLSEHFSFGVMAAVLLLSVGALSVMRAKRPMLLMVCAGLVGYGSALIFIFIGAPDVALTQFVVETILVVILVSILLMLRRSDIRRYQAEKVHYGALVLAIVFASLLTFVIMLVIAMPFDASLTTYFSKNSYTEAHGLNVVNVILVDFRAIDTFGETSVLLLSLLAAWPLLSALYRRRQAALANKTE
ncbi:hydrogen gas-evolving membrane-bound hydrogenase subunit E [Suttonella ornithocola]|uniref:Multiple resistance and pH homeostasis protein A n=1 Tax=Suttonella ornithocola TaxID=279832 RepID=A0A380MQR1_9GAMM|nr:hydrogen gas-evolving membrane-bound hydrogenase subunit E [Suttonella ornithocola]SUO94504.1 Multiple resistance and pH homeostasis protein A [Suttonella ornithocola]